MCLITCYHRLLARVDGLLRVRLHVQMHTCVCAWMAGEDIGRGGEVILCLFTILESRLVDQRHSAVNSAIRQNCISFQTLHASSLTHSAAAHERDAHKTALLACAVAFQHHDMVQ